MASHALDDSDTVRELRRRIAGLQAVNERLHGILEGSRDLVAALDLEFRFVAFNAAYRREFARLFGREVAVGTSLADALAHRPQDRAKVVGHWQRALQGEEFTVVESFGEGAAAGVYETTFSILRDESGRRIGASHIARNIADHLDAEVRRRNEELEGHIRERTERLVSVHRELESEIDGRRLADLALRESESRLRQLADAMPQIVWAARPDGFLDYFNAQWYALTGATEGVGGDESWLPVLHPDDRQRARDRWYESVRTGTPYQIEYRFQFRHSGEYRWHLARALPVRDHAGHIVRWYGTCTDIHDQKRAAEAVRDSEARFRGIFENAAVGMAQVDRGGRWVQVNQTLCDITGYSREELLQKTFQDVTHPDDMDDDLDLFAPMMRGDIASYSMEKRYVHKQGHAIWVNLTTALQRDAAGEPLFGIGIVEDITSRKKAEQELRELNETLEQRIAQRTAQLRLLATELTQAEQRERRRLAYALHEDIQQLMVAVKMKVGQLGRRAPDDLLGDVAQAEQLLHQLIQASRSLAVQLSPPILYDAGLGPALEWLGRKIGDEYGLTVRVAADAHVRPSDQNISLFLLQSVRELLLNAVKYAGIDEAFVTLSGTEDDQVRILVEDRGVGIDPQSLRATEASADRFGLFSIEHRLVLLGGRFLLESVPGRGTRITLTAPLRPPLAKPAEEPPPAPAAAAAAPHGDGSRIGVLLVDDHRILRQGLARLLAAESDMEVIGEAADGMQALELARQLQPDVVCMDVTMPRMSGVEATRRILAERPDTRVIGLSMHENRDMAAAMRDAGAVGYLSKDGPSDELIATIRSAAGKADDPAEPLNESIPRP